MLTENQTFRRLKEDSVFKMLDDLRNIVALVTSKSNVPDNICHELDKYGINLTPWQISYYLEQKPITRFEKAMAKNLEGIKNNYKPLIFTNSH